MHTPMFSLEVFPPKRDAPVGTIYDTLDGLEGLNPDFISVTYGHGTHSDRTATARIANTIHGEYGIPAVAHLTALYSDEAKIDEALDMFEAAGVSAVLALRGDYIDGEEPVGRFNHASDQDIGNLKIKVDAGVTHLISQLFYDNDDFYRFLDKAHAAGIDVPIEAGIMPVRGAKSVRRMAKVNASRIPAKLEALLDRWGDDIQNLRAAGIIYASDQIADLVAHGVDGVHLYSMNHPATTRRIWRNVEPLFTVE